MRGYRSRLEGLYAGAGVRPYPGAERLLRELAGAGVKLALATSSQLRWVEMKLAGTDILACFDEVVTADDVERGKPEPDIYLAAARALSVEPASCVAVEDSWAGVESAVAAGMMVVAVAGTVSPDTLAGADVVVEGLAGVREAVTKLLSAGPRSR